MPVDVHVTDAAVLVLVDVEATGTPAVEEPDGESDDHERDRGLGTPPHRLGQVLAEHDDGEPEGKQGRRVAEPPEEAEPPGAPAGTLVPAGDERRDRGEMVGIGRVAEAEQDGDRDHDPDGDPV